jgi:Phosphotransferase enzyme family
MHKDFPDIIKQTTGSTQIELTDVIQELWSGYGAIMRYRLSGTERSTVVVKHVRLPQESDHPRGWNTNRSHQRKIRSYEVETAWYRSFANRCDDHCPVPHCLAVAQRGEETLMVLEDLDAVGYPLRRDEVSEEEIVACLKWLAHFHATFMGVVPDGLWTQGTYWHMDTRPDELEALDDLPLKAAAPVIDRILKEARFQTLVHGDAKLANFCFSTDGRQVAAVDFQYVGGGCGMKDMAYFIGSCLSEADCERLEGWLLQTYFTELQLALAKRQPQIDVAEVEAEWCMLYPLAWTDFHRFLKGWSPGHWKINEYSERLARQVIKKIAL